MQTFWIDPISTGSAGSVASGQSCDSFDSLDDCECGDLDLLDKEERETFRENKLRQQRLISWNVEILCGLLKKITAHRQQYGVQDNELHTPNFPLTQPQPINELTQVIEFPSFKGVIPPSEDQPLPDDVKPQLTKFVREVSNFYRDVPFHNFAHASHVVMSAAKLMKRIVDPNNVTETSGRPLDFDTAKQIHDATYGLSSDPLMQFSVVFSALIQ